MVFSWDAVNWNMVMAFGAFVLIIFAAQIYLILGAKNRQQRLWSVAFFLAAAIFFPAVMFGPAVGPWEPMTSGTYDHAQYVDTPRRTSHGARYTRHETVIFFEDGRTQVVSGSYTIPFPKGTLIEIFTKNGKYKIVER